MRLLLREGEPTPHVGDHTAITVPWPLPRGSRVCRRRCCVCAGMRGWPHAASARTLGQRAREAQKPLWATGLGHRDSGSLSGSLTTLCLCVLPWAEPMLASSVESGHVTAVFIGCFVGKWKEVTGRWKAWPVNRVTFLEQVLRLGDLKSCGANRQGSPTPGSWTGTGL